MIDTVMFDMGGTLEDLYHGDRTYRKTAKALHALLMERGVDPGMDAQALWETVYPGYLEYHKWSEEHTYELKPARIWVDYGFRNAGIPLDKIQALSEDIAHMWELTYFERKMRDRVPEMLAGLKGLGLRLSVVSNTACEFQVFDTLEEYGIRSYFDDVTLSSVVGYRKPDPRIMLLATRQMRTAPQRCVYVGDTLARDVIGARNAGFKLTIQIHSFLTQSRDANIPDSVHPDYRVEDIFDVYPVLAEYIKTH